MRAIEIDKRRSSPLVAANPLTADRTQTSALTDGTHHGATTGLCPWHPTQHTTAGNASQTPVLARRARWRGARVHARAHAWRVPCVIPPPRVPPLSYTPLSLCFSFSVSICLDPCTLRPAPFPLSPPPSPSLPILARPLFPPSARPFGLFPPPCGLPATMAFDPVPATTTSDIPLLGRLGIFLALLLAVRLLTSACGRAGLFPAVGDTFGALGAAVAGVGRAAAEFGAMLGAAARGEPVGGRVVGGGGARYRVNGTF